MRLYSREPDGTRGVVFLSLDASRLAVVLAARAVGIPYVWSRARFRGVDPLDPVDSVDSVVRSAGPEGPEGLACPEGPCAGYSVRRYRGGARSDFAVAPEPDAEVTDPLSVHLTARFGLHTRFRGRTLYVPNTHNAWPLYRAQLTRCEDQLVAAAGINVARPPESVLFSPGVRTQFGRPRVLDAGP